MGFLTSERVISSMKWIFDGSGGMRDQLEQCILKTLQQKEYPLSAKIETIKSGGVFGSKDQCVTIDTGKKKRVLISNTTVGTYLYVGVYLLAPFSNINGQAAYIEPITDLFAMQQIDALYEAAIAACESAFDKLGLVQANRGYKRNNSGS